MIAEGEPAAEARARCPGCASELPPGFLACPSCGGLLHAEELKQLAASAAEAERAGDAAAALIAFRRMLELLPVGSVQHQRVAERVREQSERANQSPGSGTRPADAAPSSGRRRGWVAALGVAGVFLLKFKWALLFLLSKGKLLLLGLTKAKTLLSMAIALGVYVNLYGWKFAGGLIVSMYVHEMGHVAWLRRYGIASSAPMFIPGLGAFVRLKQHPATVGEDARVGLAGPIWGAGAALVFLAVGLVAGWPSWLATARVGAWLNLFNMLPVWQLDGGRGFAALSRRQRGTIAAALWALALLGVDGFLFILAIAATARVPSKEAPATGDPPVFWTYLALAVGFTAMMGLIHLPAPPR